MNFSSLGLSADLRPLLDEQGITVPTPIQALAIPVALDGSDLIGIAQTGTGKTLAFGLPLLEALRSGQGKALIIAPTRELATQIATALRHFTGPFRITTAIVVGGAGMQKQTQDLRRNPRIVIATPGRLIDQMMQGNIRMHEFTHVVLDEADRMLDMGFVPAIKRVFQKLPQNRQTLMFSATMPPAIAELTEEFLRNPKRVEVAPQGTTVDLITQAAYIVGQDEKGDLLNDLITATTGPVLVFARTRHGARKVAKALRDYGHTAVELHADRTQLQRDTAMAGFRSGRNRIMVATDIASRGIDVKNIGLVVQYDIPDADEDYVHRIGRTGRAGAEGRAVILVTPEHSKKLDMLERSIGFDIPTASDTPLPRPSRTIRHMPRPPRNQGDPRPDTRRNPRPFSPKRPQTPIIGQSPVQPEPHQSGPRITPRRPSSDRPGRPERPVQPTRFSRGPRPTGPQRFEPKPKERPESHGGRNSAPNAEKMPRTERVKPAENSEGAKASRPKPSGTPKAFAKSRSKKRHGIPSNGFAPPKKRRQK